MKMKGVSRTLHFQPLAVVVGTTNRLSATSLTNVAKK